MSSKLTEEEIENLIAENARLKASLKYYTNGKRGIRRPQIPIEVLEKHGKLDEDCRTKLSWLIRYWLFKNTLSTTSHFAVTRSQGPVKREKTSLISIESMNDDQYQAYTNAFIGIVDVLDTVREKLTNQEGENQ